MEQLFEMKQFDKDFYSEHLQNFLPHKIIDIHTHVWLDEIAQKNKKLSAQRVVIWPTLVAKDNPIEDLQETYRLMFPDKEVSALIFASGIHKNNIQESNDYVAHSSEKSGFPALYYSHPNQSEEELFTVIQKYGFFGLKSYLNLAKEYIPESEIRIFDFFPHHQLKLIDKLGLMIMLHVPRHGRLKDPVNLAQIIEIKEKYPNIKLVIAHVGRAYCENDIGNAFDVLKDFPDLLFDFCANSNDIVFTKFLEKIGPERLLFGSDMPILRMRCNRITENGHYINLVPKGLYGDVSGDKNMREIDNPEAEKLTFFMYEEINALKKAVNKCKLNSSDIENIFHNNSEKLLTDIKKNLQKIR